MNQDETEKLVSHLRRLEGQVRGVAGMIYKKESITKVAVQLRAVRSSIDSVISNYLSLQIKPESGGQCILDAKTVEVILREIRK